jgi:tetratricopeptide (TPR) repeat protein
MPSGVSLPAIPDNPEAPRVTVILVPHGCSGHLREAVECVLAQRFPDWELLVVHDGEREVGQTVADFGDDRIICWQRPTTSAYAARLNFAVGRARGDYVAYLGEADIWYPNHLEVLVQALDRNTRFGAAYSDSYEVRYVPGRGVRRIPLQKRVKLCRDFSRSSIFAFNHVLPLSLMHRRGLAERVGGFREDVTRLNHWNLNRKLAYLTDFLHVSVITGEHYVRAGRGPSKRPGRHESPDVDRELVRRIRADHPPEPWQKIHSVGVILPVKEWGKRTRTAVRHFVDDLAYPCRIMLVNQMADMADPACRREMGPLGGLAHIGIMHENPEASPRQAYQAAAESLDAEYYYLAGEGLCPQTKNRLIRGLAFLCREVRTDVVRWEEDGSDEGFSDLLTTRGTLKGGELQRRLKTGNVEAVPRHWKPPEMRVDDMVFWADRCLRDGDHRRAGTLLRETRRVAEGGVGDPCVADLVARLSFLTGRFEEASELCGRLMEDGYVAANAVRLGMIEQEKQNWVRAIELYERALEAIGITATDLADPALPALVCRECDAFRAMVGLGECHLELENWIRAGRFLRNAAAICATGGRPYLGLGWMFLKTRRLKKALHAFRMALRRTDGRERADAHLGMAEACEKGGQVRRAWQHCRKAVDAAPGNKRCLEIAERLIPRAAASEDLAGFYEGYLQHCPGDWEILFRLSEIYRQQGWDARARDVEEKLRVLSRSAREPRSDSDE